jgi:hypothetical protein
MRKITDQHVKRGLPNDAQSVAVQDVRVRHVLAQEHDKPLVKLDDSEAPGPRQLPGDGADPGPDFQDVIRGADARPRDLWGSRTRPPALNWAFMRLARIR